MEEKQKFSKINFQIQVQGEHADVRGVLWEDELPDPLGVRRVYGTCTVGLR